MKSREQILQRYVGRNYVEKNHVEGETEKNKSFSKVVGSLLVRREKTERRTI